MTHFERKQKENGITLVALVITVIVLLILAAVSMSLISGNGDLFGKANTAAETMKTAEKNEQNEYNNLMSFINTYYGQNGGNSGGAGGSGDTTQGGQSSQTGDTPAGGDTTTKYTVTYNTHGANETVAEETDKASGAKVTLPTVTKASSTFKGWYTAETEGTRVGGAGEEYTVTGTVTLHAQWEAVAADPTGGIGAVNNTYKGDFGKIVTGTSVPTIDTVSTWRLFYADNDYVYLIGDPIGNTTYQLNDTSVVEGFGSSTISTLGRNLNSKFTNKSSWTLDSNNDGTRNENIQAVEALLDTTKWEEYKGTGAVWAIGAPTLEMFIASYNATHDKQIECDVEANATGYKVKWSTDSSYDTYITNLGNSADIDKAIYAPSSGVCWLASPSAGSSYDVVYACDSDGYLCGVDLLYGFGVRSLVSYPISKINNGLTIENYYFVTNSGD